MCVFLRTIRVAQNTPDILQGSSRVFASVRIACRGRHAETEFDITEHVVAAAALVLFVCIIFTISFYDDDILGLVKIVSSPVHLEEADHLIDTM